MSSIASTAPLDDNGAALWRGYQNYLNAVLAQIPDLSNGKPAARRPEEVLPPEPAQTPRNASLWKAPR